jgi:hypothetical protein
MDNNNETIVFTRKNQVYKTITIKNVKSLNFSKESDFKYTITINLNSSGKDSDEIELTSNIILGGIL